MENTFLDNLIKHYERYVFTIARNTTRSFLKKQQKNEKLALNNEWDYSESATINGLDYSFNYSYIAHFIGFYGGYVCVLLSLLKDFDIRNNNSTASCYETVELLLFEFLYHNLRFIIRCMCSL